MDNETFKIGDNIDVKCIHTPCHTQDSICYYLQDSKTGERAVFTGDTLFTGSFPSSLSSPSLSSFLLRLRLSRRSLSQLDAVASSKEQQQK